MVLARFCPSGTGPQQLAPCPGIWRYHERLEPRPRDCQQMSEPKGVNGYLITKRADGWHLINFHGDSVAGVFETESMAIAVAEVFVDEAGHASSKRPKTK